MKNYPFVSVVINNYNYGRFLADAINSALNQSYPHREVIVVDDGSTDNSREVIAAYGDKIVAVIKENGGQPSAFNAGFATSKGDIICFLDADDLFLPEKLENVVAAFGENQDLGWCFHPLKFVDIREIDINSAISQAKNNHQYTAREYDLRSQIQKGRLDKNFPYPSTSGMCFRRSFMPLILPMPEKAEGTLLNDGYLIFASIGLSKGIALDQQLGLYRIHGDNAHGFVRKPGTDTYVVRSDKQQRKAKLYVLKAYWLGVNFPQLIKLANYLMATGIGIYRRNGGVEKDYQKLVSSHLSSVSLLDRLEIYARSFYIYLKNPQN